MAALLLPLALPASARRPVAPPPSLFYAAQSGEETLDEGHGGGNPFASALIEALGRPGLSLAALPAVIAELTDRNSEGFQAADVPDLAQLSAMPLGVAKADGKRIALVAIQSNYGSGMRLPHLPGAARDGQRVARALEQAGYQVDYVANLDRPELVARLEAFARRSARADVAIIYSTGHGIQRDGVVHLLMGNITPWQQRAELDDYSVTVDRLAAAAHARKANLIFWAGCRTEG